jgi:hypothetical protein
MPVTRAHRSGYLQDRTHRIEVARSEVRFEENVEEPEEKRGEKEKKGEI